jgi:hypothetical protein
MNLNDMTVSELRKIAAQFDISGRSTMKKAELIAALSADEFAGALAIMGGIAELEAEEREMSEIRAEIAAEASHIEEGIERDAAARTYTSVNEVAVLRDAPGRAIVTAAFDGRIVGGSIVRIGNRYLLTAGFITIKANSLNKVAKLFAKRLGFHADVIDIDRVVC